MLERVLPEYLVRIFPWLVQLVSEAWLEHAIQQRMDLDILCQHAGGASIYKSAP